MLQWYVIIAKQNQEYLVARGLREQDYADVYLAKRYEKHPASKWPKPSLLIRPYVFVLLDVAKKEHGPLKNIRGVERLLADNPEFPEPLRNGGFKFISRLRQAEDEELCAASISPTDRDDLNRGMWVRIDKPGLLTRDCDGEAVPLEGMIVLIERKKVTVLVGQTEFKVDAVDLTEVARK